MSMSTLCEQLSAVSGVLLPVLLDAAVKSMAILTLTTLATLGMRRASAAARHLVWFLGTLSLLIVPIFSAALPGWHILPRWPIGDAAPSEQVSAPVIAAAPAPWPSAPDAQLLRSEASPRAETIRPALTPITETQLPLPAAPPLRLTWQAWSMLTWLTGSALLLGYVAMGFASLWWLQRRSSRIAGGGWPALLCRLGGELGFRRPVELLCSTRRTMPMTWGLWRTRILLPDDSATWTADECRAVLMHELAHAKRFDCLTQLIMQVACALYWFNPLVWLAWNRMQAEREQACDDLVLNSGTKASAYAEQLLRIAAEMPAVRFSAGAIAVARPSKLEGRLLAILNVTRNRRSLTWTALAAAAFLLLTVTVPLAMVRAENGGGSGPAERLAGAAATSVALVSAATTDPAVPSFDDSPGWLNRITAGQLGEAYDQLPANRKLIVDGMDAFARKQYLGGRYAAHHRAAQAATNQVDPEIRAIVDAKNDDLEPASAVRERILAYLQKNPQTPFAGDLYFYMAQLYSGWTRLLLGEHPDHQKAIEYFQKAHALYGEKFSYNNECAWASLANMTGSNSEQRAHYDWLKKLASNGGPDDVYPICDLERVLKGHPIELSQAEKTVMMDSYRKGNVARSLSQAEIELSNLARGKPQRPVPNRASTQPASAATIDFRIAAQIGKGDKPAGNLLPYTLAEALIRSLRDKGPRGRYDRPSGFDWFEITSADVGRLVSGAYQNRRYVLLMESEPYTMLAEQEGRRSWGLKQVSLTKDREGLTQITVEFDASGDERFGKLTGTNLRRPLAFLIDGKVVMVATINSKITAWVTIDGGSQGFDPATAERIVEGLRQSMRPVAPAAATEPAAGPSDAPTPPPAASVESAQSAHEILRQIAEGVHHQRSLLGAYRYEMTQMTSETAAGTRIFWKRVGDEGGARIEPPTQDKPARTDFVRLVDHGKESLFSTRYDANLKPAGHFMLTWNGASGKQYDDVHSQGTLLKARPGEMDQHADSVMLSFLGRPLEDLLEEKKDVARVFREGACVCVSFDMTEEAGMQANICFDPAVGYLPRHSGLTVAGHPRMTWEINEFQQVEAGGGIAFFPRRYHVVLYIVKDHSSETIPRLLVESTVNKVQANIHVPPNQFDITFPKGATVYNEFTGNR